MTLSPTSSRASGAPTLAQITALFAASGQVFQGTGAGTGGLALPPDYQYDYVEATGTVAVTSTNAAAPTTIITHNAVTFDGATRVLIEFYCYNAQPNNQNISFALWDGATDLGLVTNNISAVTQSGAAVVARRFMTPSAGAHTFSWRGFVNAGTVNVNAGAGGAGTPMPMWARITKT